MHADTEGIIFDRQIADETTDSIITPRRTERFSEVYSSFLSLTSSNENHATNETKYLEEDKNSPNMASDLKTPELT